METIKVKNCFECFFYMDGSRVCVNPTAGSFRFVYSRKNSPMPPVWCPITKGQKFILTTPPPKGE